MSGEAIMPWQFIGEVKEVWKAVDQIIRPAKARAYSLHIAAHAGVRRAIVTPAGKISGWKHPDPYRWGGSPSSAPCRRPIVKQGTVHGQATVAYVTAGMFKGEWVQVRGGVTVVSKEIP
jgi:hypothetical protein